MNKIFGVYLFILLSFLVFSPISVNAITVSDGVSVIENVKLNQNNLILIGADEPLLGYVDDEKSVAWLLQQVFNVIKIVGPVIVIVLSSIDFAKVIIKNDDEAMAKAQKKLIIRLILAASLFFIPLLVELALKIFGLTGSSTGGIK
ncbi:MAG: hypothetical protein IJJ63_01810 [Bacilli bacterium]|nr:hypothetical protein [Bacilli bacterium]